LTRAIEHPNAHVRRAAALALGHCSSDRDAAIRGLERALRDVSPAVRAGALIARTRLDVNEPWDELPTLQKAARLLSPMHTARDRLREWIKTRDPHVRAAAATAAGLLAPNEAIPLLAQLAADEHPLPAGAAIEELGKLGDANATAIVRAALRGTDDGVRLAAVLALGDAAGPADVPLLERALELARGEIEPEIAFNIAQLLGRIGGPSARESCTRIAAHREPWVRHIAFETLRTRFAATAEELDALASAAWATATVPLAALPPSRLENPLVRIDTTRGSLVFELYAAECPLHVHSFIERARAGFYNGTTFHRVVPDFVVQGGDRRGDGNGGSSWRGDALRNEFTPRKFRRGTLGMPRNDNPDSGGSQLFATHRATPHLDGRYTAFGDLRVGFEVLDRLEIGDQILKVDLLR
jgi:cyclophilin family peptidyl-prolyl cis-trans isomerase